MMRINQNLQVSKYLSLFSFFSSLNLIWYSFLFNQHHKLNCNIKEILHDQLIILFISWFATIIINIFHIRWKKNAYLKLKASFPPLSPHRIVFFSINSYHISPQISPVVISEFRTSLTRLFNYARTF